jgi:hypothetical protein
MIPQDLLSRFVLVALCVAAPLGELANGKASQIDPELLGTWHSMEIHCADLAARPSSESVLSAQLTIENTGRFNWLHFVDLGEPDQCSAHFKLTSPNVLQSDDCDLNPYGDHFSYEIKDGSLILTGTDPDGDPGAPPEQFTLRFVRGPLRLRWSEPIPCVCNQIALPHWAASAVQVTSLSDLALLESGSYLKDRVSESNRLLWKAVQAFEGKGAPIALKHIAYSIEGDKLEEYLRASHGRAELVEHTDEGMIEHLSTCTCQLPIIKLKVKSDNPGSPWRFASKVPLPSEKAYITYPTDYQGTRFPKF